MIFYKDGRSQQHPAGVEAFQEGFWKSVPSYAQVKAALAYYFRPDLGFAAIKAMDWTDGVRIFFANRDIAHIRPSGNAPQLRIYANADSQERADEIVRQGIADNGLLRNMEADITRPH
jgi:phosphomannomutase